MLSYIDIHSHLSEDNNEHSGIICHPTISVSDDIIFSYPEPFWCGLHPNETMSESELISRLLRVKDNIIGVGEIGLDALRGAVGQEKLFRAQLLFASEHKLVVTLHSVRSHNEVDKIIKEYKLKALINHSFIGSKEIARGKTARGEYLSFSPMSLRSSKTIEALKQTPHHLLFCETDSQGDIVEVYKKVSEILNIELEELVTQLYKNYLCLIG